MPAFLPKGSPSRIQGRRICTPHWGVVVSPEIDLGGPGHRVDVRCGGELALRGRLWGVWVQPEPLGPCRCFNPGRSWQQPAVQACSAGRRPWQGCLSKVRQCSQLLARLLCPPWVLGVPSGVRRQAEDAGPPWRVAGAGGRQLRRQGQLSGPPRGPHTFPLLEVSAVPPGHLHSLLPGHSCGHRGSLALALFGGCPASQMWVKRQSPC